MKTSKQYLERRQDWNLRLQQSNSTSAFQPIAALKTIWQSAIWQSFVRTVIGSNELQVWQTTDPDGYLHWRAHDPLTGESVTCDSEDEMRAWIEQRYHHHPDVAEQQYQKQYYQLLPLR